MAPERPGQTPPTILIVEDHEDSGDALAQLLGSLGYQVLVARNGVQALGFLSTLRPDLILCDLRMPGMDGFTFLAALRQDPKLADLRVVAVTALVDQAHLRRTYEAGFAGHVAKPIDYDTIVSTLDRVLGPRRPSDRRA